jgi:hypothetical protein
MSYKLEIYILNGSSGYDVSGLVKKVVWKGKKSSAARSIEVTMVDDNTTGQARVKFDVSAGYTCIFKYNSTELFRGIIMKQTQSEQKLNKWKAYDSCIYLANSKDSFSYDNKTATYIFKDCVKRAGLTVGSCADTGYKIPSLKKSKAYFFDCILDALSTTYSAKGKRYYVKADGKKVSLLRRKENTTQWVCEIGANITGYTYSQSIEKIKTKFRIYSDEGKVVYEKTNASLEKKIGSFIMMDSVDDTYNDAQIKELVNTLVSENGYPEQSLTIESLGIISATSGGCLYVVIPHLGLKRTFYIDEDTHTFDGENHTMNLKLNFAADIDAAG